MLTHTHTHTDQLHSTSGNCIISLKLLGDYIQKLTSHAAICGHPIKFLGETRRIGLSSILVSRCTKCLKIQKMHTSDTLSLQGKNHCSQHRCSPWASSHRRWRCTFRGATNEYGNTPIIPILLHTSREITGISL